MEQPMLNLTDIRENIERLRERIHRSCAAVHRRSDEITCVAVAKGRPAVAVRSAVTAGLADIAENRVQEALAKSAELADLPIRRHLIGTLQTNKVRHAVKLFDVIHSLDRIELARAIQTEGERQNRTMDVLIQVEVTGEPAKHGAKPQALQTLADAVKTFDRLRLRGLMAIGPLTVESEKIRASFRSARELFESLRKKHGSSSPIDTLSMGMSDDFEIAVQEGSTLIRVGTLIFGPRPKI